MADTRPQHRVERWVREVWMPAQFGEAFTKGTSKLSSGGLFEFDAVGQDRLTVALISTGGYLTAKGKPGVGKVHKIQADMYFLMLAEAERGLVILTGKDMFEFLAAQKDSGRVPKEMAFHLVDLPAELRSSLDKAKAAASREVSPGGGTRQAVPPAQTGVGHG